MTTLERLVAEAGGLPSRDELADELHDQAEKLNGLAYCLFYSLANAIDSGDTEDADVLNAILSQSLAVSDQAKKVKHLALRQLNTPFEGGRHDQE